ncbi:MAG: hypothetical protein HYR72_08205 [Deltaproteobacteria bacterium]|nr:hypothetical protein [Deltaproteobacteria bacterium]MBI3386693.1 hypothetical protein [Deltaproteobacteria bacterium]
MKTLKKPERLELIRRRAFEYAASGKFEDWYRIERALYKEGLKEARTELDRRLIREQLNEACRQARQKGES